jgi:FkbM family methyltransferase
MLGRAVDLAARWVRPIVPRGSRLYARLEILRLRLPSARPLSPVEEIIRTFAAAYPDAYFVQIGSNDGSNLDPLRRSILTHRWRGILIEPVPYIFRRLQDNYRYRSGLILENLAIADQDGHQDFYYLRRAEDASGLPRWYDTLGSFSRDVILSHRNQIPDIEQRLVSEKVACVTLESLCRRHGVRSVDLIHIDAEGYDDRILQQVDLSKLRPRVLMYEHHHLAPAARAACRARLAAHGYDTFEHGMDTLGLDLRNTGERDRELIERWHQVRAR